jgi:integral membrane protein
MTTQAKRGIFSSPRKAFLTFAFGEALTWSLLLGGLAFRALVGLPQPVITVIGGLHGAMFLGYAVIASLVGVNNRWHVGRIVLGVALAIVPFATLPFERNVEEKGLLAGNWRRESSTDPRDDNWFDRLFRWFLNRPVLLAITMLLVVSAIFAALLIVGPPGGWPKDNG